MGECNPMHVILFLFEQGRQYCSNRQCTEIPSKEKHSKKNPRLPAPNILRSIPILPQMQKNMIHGVGPPGLSFSALGSPFCLGPMAMLIWNSYQITSSQHSFQAWTGVLLFFIFIFILFNNGKLLIASAAGNEWRTNDVFGISIKLCLVGNIHPLTTTSQKKTTVGNAPLAWCRVQRVKVLMMCTSAVHKWLLSDWINKNKERKYFSRPNKKREAFSRLNVVYATCVQQEKRSLHEY